MVHVSLGRILLKPTAGRLRFYWYTVGAYWQARWAKGNVHVSVHGEDGRTFWSLSVWRTPEAMQRYRDTGSHRRAMQASARLAERIEFRHWQAESVPDIREAIAMYRQSAQE